MNYHSTKGIFHTDNQLHAVGMLPYDTLKSATIKLILNYNMGYGVYDLDQILAEEHHIPPLPHCRILCYFLDNILIDFIVIY